MQPHASSRSSSYADASASLVATVKPDSSTELHKALREAGGSKVKLSIMPGHDHFSLAEQVFAGEEIYKWLFTHVQGVPPQFAFFFGFGRKS